VGCNVVYRGSASDDDDDACVVGTSRGVNCRKSNPATAALTPISTIAIATRLPDVPGFWVSPIPGVYASAARAQKKAARREVPCGLAEEEKRLVAKPRV
jgi:hypothetical protein